ncbi:MAG: indole-3-glycerol phosphate synthase TrpC [Candidatus Caenarcaniphilales bacterium]|nr:indole-3-glycerol phosphate synthase TrpC [Candidatus Caenarcaniphilales bacterium]
MENILDKIIRQKRIDLELRKSKVNLKDLIKKAESLSGNSTVSFYDSLQSSSQSAIIAEVKRVSPSKGPLRPELNPIELALDYQKAGAKAISVLTEEKFFMGSDNDLLEIKSKTEIPILRKDFTIDEYQIWEAKLLGASAILLIAAVLSEEVLIEFSGLAKTMGLDVLLEVHDRDETIKALKAKPKILGVNNRNLKTFEVSLETSKNIIQEFRNSQVALWVSESGIYDATQIKELKQSGFKAFLIGESLLKAKEPQSKLQELINNS